MRLLPSHLKEKGVKLAGNAVYYVPTHIGIHAAKGRHQAGITH